MSTLQILTLIPVIFIMCCSLWVKCSQRKFKEAALLTLTGICTLINIYLVYEMIVGELSVASHMVQMGACAAIIPLIYAFFIAHVNIKDYRVMALLWVLALLSFIPNVIIYNPFEPFEYTTSQMHPFTLYAISQGQKVFAIYMGDLMVTLQACVCLYKFIPFAFRIRKIGLHLSLKTFIFIAWTILCAVAIIALSFMTYEQLRSQSGEIIYFVTYTLIVVSFNIFILLRFECDLLETKEGKAIEDLNEYVIARNKELAAAMDQIMTNENLYLNPNCTAEYFVERLNTNRTYFSQMLTYEYGMSFNEYITDLRMKYIENLLSTTDMTIAEIALKSGFNDSGYMARRFREKNGVTPSVWRNSIRK